ncbi:MAG: hypothetical protein QME57_04265 [Patescibacteria group bacterium]|nr:hypothetical protein [Patescibacteria group bacterium]
MSEQIAKIFGWGLLIFGVIIIGWTLYSSYNIFTGKVVLPEFFEIPAEKQISIQKETTQDIQAQLQQMLEEQLKGILPVDTLTKLLNLVVWSILAGILIFGGSQISGLGIKLIKK